MLNQMTQKLKLAGYVVETSEVLVNIDEVEKENSISLHSERLAISYGWLKTQPGAQILILKNLRVCSNWHYVFKLISKIYKRK